MQAARGLLGGRRKLDAAAASQRGTCAVSVESCTNSSWAIFPIRVVNGGLVPVTA